MTRLRAAAAALVVLAAVPALAFIRSEARDRNMAPIAGRCLWWPSGGLTYVLNPTAANTAGCRTRDELLSLARASLATWEGAAAAGDVCTSFAFRDGGTTGSTVAGYVDGAVNQNLIVWRRTTCADAAPGDPCQGSVDLGACADKFNCWPYGDGGTIALTTTSYRVSTGEILDADMELHDRDEVRRTGQWLTCPVRPPAAICATDPDQPNDTVRPDGSCVSIDLGGTVTHEAGHMLGLAHPCEFESNRDAGVRQCRTGSDPAQDVTMFPTSPIGDSSKRTLEDDDVAAVCTVYPRGGAPQATGGAGQSGSACASAAVAAPSGGGGSGCSTAGPADGAPLLLVLAALARRRLRLR